jgi:tetratricopeptide (TPR) repeat protein
MPRLRPRSTVSLLVLASSLLSLPLFGQSAPATPATKPPAAAVTPEKAVELAEQGHCKEAIPSLKRAVTNATNSADLRKNAGVLGLRCSLSLDDRDSAALFAQQIYKQFPKDPDVLFIVVHAYSDLSTRAAQDLGRTAPQSVAAHKLMAEAFEMQGKWDEAEHEYEGIIQREPNVSGVHFLLGRDLLSQPNASPEAVERAKQEFQKELQINPKNDGAHYILGELARKDNNCDEAIPQFSAATKLNPNFAEAYLGLGYCLITVKKFDDAITQLRVAERLIPFNGSVHYALGQALSFSGQKEEAQKEFAIHRNLTDAALPPASNGGRPQ